MQHTDGGEDRATYASVMQILTQIQGQLQSLAEAVEDLSSNVLRERNLSKDSGEEHVQQSGEVKRSTSVQGTRLQQDCKAVQKDTRLDAGVYPPDFEAWYEHYPRKAQKKEALKAWRDAVGHRVSQSDLIAATKAFSLSCRGTLAKWVPHPATWLRRDGWTETKNDDVLGASDEPGNRAADRLIQQHIATHRHLQKWPDYVVYVRAGGRKPYEEWEEYGHS